MPLKISWNELFVVLIFLAFSCAHPSKKNVNKLQSNHVEKKKNNYLVTKDYYLEDSSGNFLLKKKVKYIDRKIVSLNQIFKNERSNLLLEKSILVSNFKVNRKKQKRLFRPEVSQYIIWLDKKRYSSQISLNYSTKKLELLTDGPEEKDKSIKYFDFSKAKTICFLSQLIECLSAQRITNQMVKNKNSTKEISVLFDSYPFHKDQYNMSNYALIQDAVVLYVGRYQGKHRFELILDNQKITFNLEGNGKLNSFFWVKQGISLIERKGI